MMTLLMILHQGRPERSGFSFSLCFLFLVQPCNNLIFFSLICVMNDLCYLEYLFYHLFVYYS